METHHTERPEEPVEVEFRVSDRDLFFVDASALTGASISLAELFPRADGLLLEYFTIEGVPPDQVVEVVRDASAIDEARLVRAVEESSLFEFVVSGPCIAGTLAEVGATARDVEAVDGVGRVVTDVPPHVGVRDVVESVCERHDAEFVARREHERSAPEFMGKAFRTGVIDRLTERQLESLRTALAAGYYRWPREATAEECADVLGISQPTFTQHLRAAEEKVLEDLLEEVNTDPPVAIQ